MCLELGRTNKLLERTNGGELGLLGFLGLGWIVWAVSFGGSQGANGIKKTTGIFGGMMISFSLTGTS